MYDIIFITNLPSFYKINLFNRLAVRRKILVVFTHDNHFQRTNDFFKGNRDFDFVSIANKSILLKIINLLKILNSNSYKKIIIGGWDQLLFWIVAFLYKKKCNCVLIESSIFESKISGYKGLIKRAFLSRISQAYCSGKSQAEILEKLNFRGRIIKTNGVGIINIVEQPNYKEQNIVDQYVYVGRLSKEKNLRFLVETFNRLPHLDLHLIGYGPEESYLRKIAHDNIFIYGEVANKELPKLLQNMHVFVLPSSIEPWGLVIEEALNNGLPVIVSNKVGCVNEFATDNLGLVFNLNHHNSLFEAIVKITNLDLYNQLRYNISELNFNTLAIKQVESYYD